MSANNTLQRRRCKRLLTRSRNPKIAFGWSSTQSDAALARRTGRIPDFLNQPALDTLASHWTKPKLAGLGFSSCRQEGHVAEVERYTGVGMRGELEAGSGATMVNIAGFVPGRAAAR